MKLRFSTVAAHAFVLALATAILPISLPAADSANAGAAKIVRVWTAFREAKSFVRLSEYFDGKENPGRAIVLRSQPEQRSGFYFTVRLDARDKTALPDGRVVLHVIAPDAEKPRTFEFPFAADAKRSALFEIGVTGTDWTHDKQQPLAWKLEFFAADGSRIAGRESFLWAKPAAPAP